MSDNQSQSHFHFHFHFPSLKADEKFAEFILRALSVIGPLLPGGAVITGLANVTDQFLENQNQTHTPPPPSSPVKE